MAKLYPPSIEGKLPAFAGNTLKVPLTMNRTVNFNQVGSMRAQVKTVQTNQLKAVLVGALSYESTTGKYYAIFDLGDFKPTLGQYYKIQIAYVDKTNQIGYYSSIGIIKYTSIPVVEIPGLATNFYGRYDYVGVYSQAGENQDATEKIYSYCFELTDKDGNLVATSGVQLHDASTDGNTLDASSDKWSLRKNLIKDIPFYLQYKITTMNGLEVSSAKYLVMDQDSVDIDTDLVLVSEMNFDNGGVILSFYPSNKYDEKNINISGSFVLIRSSSLDNFDSWDEVYRFTYSNVSMTVGNPVKLWEDCTVQQGIEYTYALQAYNSYGLYSNKIISINKNDTTKNSIYVDFEDIFISDGERQLKVRFNPKVSNFKETVLESKVDTIGSQFPFVMRNGSVKYKDFPISGLISLQSDPEERFLKGIQSMNFVTTRGSTPGTQDISNVLDNHLTGTNIQREREFKIAVLEWLNNGKPKLFRSPSEGNYIVRLMNVSMTPIDTLGRMLHNFTCNAYEIAQCDFTNLISLGLTSLPVSNTTSLKIGQVSLKKLTTIGNELLSIDYPDFSVQKDTIILPAMFMANITEATPGTRVGLNFANGQSEVEIEIGDTGSYYILINEYPLVSIRLVKGDWDEAKLTFNYYDDTPSDAFSSISTLALTDEIRQIIGTNFKNNIIEGLEDIRRDVGQFHYIKIMKRQIENIWKIDNSYYRTSIGLDKVEKWNRTLLYYVTDGQNNYYFDGSPERILRPEEVDFRFALNPTDPNNYTDLGNCGNPYVYICTNEDCSWIGDNSEKCPLCGEPVSIKYGDTFGRIEAIRNIEKVNAMYLGPGVIADVAYRVRTKSYVVEETNMEVRKYKDEWQLALINLDNCITNPFTTQNDYELAVAKVEDAYSKFIKVLEEAVKNERG